MPPINMQIDISSLKGVTQDSRMVKSGFLFAALSGSIHDGGDYIKDAMARGASVVLTGGDILPDYEFGEVLIITTTNPRKDFSHIVADFYNSQPENIVAVTGTNGKSSVVHFIDQIWKNLDIKSSYIGTLSGSLTTPDPVSLHKNLAELVQDGVTHVALEASSHGLDQYRVDGVRVGVAAFTNLSQDHLDYHDNMDTYFASKLRLFSEVLEEGGVAVLNANSPEFECLELVCRERSIKTISYGHDGCDISLISTVITNIGQDIEIEVYGKKEVVSLPLVGDFQAMNALCAMACVMAQFPDDNIRISEILSALGNLEGVSGRLQHIPNTEGEYDVYVDYAHTPDALENVLNALRPHTSGRLICVFGCGGDRDIEKRPLMGAIASRLADIVVITDDNPRSENPCDIRSSIMRGCDGVLSLNYDIADRRKAINFALNQCCVGDVMVIAGKGHEQDQIFNGRAQSFDDVCEVQKLMRRVKGGNV